MCLPFCNFWERAIQFSEIRWILTKSNIPTPDNTIDYAYGYACNTSCFDSRQGHLLHSTHSFSEQTRQRSRKITSTMLTNSIIKPINLKKYILANKNTDYVKATEVKHMKAKVGYEAANDSTCVKVISGRTAGSGENEGRMFRGFGQNKTNILELPYICPSAAQYITASKG